MFPSLSAGSAESCDELIETDDVIEVGGKVFHKPFVEKPVSAEDHSVYIYFPSDYGGGCQQLFRKVCRQTNLCVCVCGVCVCVCVCACACVCMCVYICVVACACVCMCTCVYAVCHLHMYVE